MRGHVPCSQTETVVHGAEFGTKRMTRPGKLHLVMGPMFAGKTTTLLEMVSMAEKSQRVALVTNSMDTRYGESQCTTHSGIARSALAVRELAALKQRSEDTNGWNMDDIDVIAIDESQFFPDLFEFCLYAVEERGKTVIAAGLNGDFQRNVFGNIVKLVPYADDVVFLKARCTFCEEAAPFTLRLVASAEQELIGGKDAYQPVCRHHYQHLSRVGREFVP
jgi:thymidine kinase